MERIFLLRLENGAVIEARAEISMEINPGDRCVFIRDFFSDLGTVVRELDPTKLTTAVNLLPQIQHIATQEELSSANSNVSRNRSAMETARTLVASLGLEMKLINAHSSLDGKLMTIQFSADGRVDFRELVKELSRALCCRIELRQIGVRDETGIHGGIAVCGQPLCCSRFLKEFNSINVKMAKEQELSLTPATISGVCGRLKCCLKYEHEGYLELAKGMPRKGEFCETPNGTGRITDRNLLTGKVMVSLENGNVSQFAVNEIKILPPVEHRPGGGQTFRRNAAPGGGAQERNGSSGKASFPLKERGPQCRNRNGGPRPPKASAPGIPAPDKFEDGSGNK